MDRRKQLEKMNVLRELAPLAASYDLDVNHMRKSEIIDAIIAHEYANLKAKEIKRRPPRHAASTKLKALRVKSGLTQREVAEKSGINTPIYSGYEQGLRSIDGAKLVTLLNICNALNCSLQDILEDQETIEALREYNK